MRLCTSTLSYKYVWKLKENSTNRVPVCKKLQLIRSAVCDSHGMDGWWYFNVIPIIITSVPEVSRHPQVQHGLRRWHLADYCHSFTDDSVDGFSSIRRRLGKQKTANVGLWTGDSVSLSRRQNMPVHRIRAYKRAISGDWRVYLRAVSIFFFFFARRFERDEDTAVVTEMTDCSRW